MTSLTFEFEEEALSQRDPYARICVQRYRIHVEDPDRDLLRALMQSAAYGTESLRYDVRAEGTHGPFVLEDLRPESFEPCDQADATAALEAWLNDPRPPTPEESAAFDERVVPRLNGNLYRLSARPDDALSIGATWLEFVALDRASGWLSLVVAWDD